jgi:hypothetical protein
MIFEPSATGELVRFRSANGTNLVSINLNDTAANARFVLNNGIRQEFFDSTQADEINLWHDGTDFRIHSVSGTTNLRVSGMDLQVDEDVQIDKILQHTDSELTIASGAITVTGSKHRVDTEADAATDDLDTINGWKGTGHILYLTSAASTRDTTVRDQSVSGGNIELDGATSFTFTNARDILVLMYLNGPAKWCEISRSNNG